MNSNDAQNPQSQDKMLPELTIEDISTCFGRLLSAGLTSQLPLCRMRGKLVRKDTWWKLEEPSGARIDVSSNTISFVVLEGRKVILDGWPEVRSGKNNWAGNIFFHLHVLSAQEDISDQEAPAKDRLSQLHDILRSQGKVNRISSRTFPSNPKKIAFIGGQTADTKFDVTDVFDKAAEGKFEEILAQRGISIVDASVPTLSPENIAEKITDEYDADILILYRGGGNDASLDFFNTSTILEALNNFQGFLVTGLGHGPNLSLSDLLADARCTVPADAAQYVVHKIMENIKTENSRKKAYEARAALEQQCAELRVSASTADKEVARLKNEANLMLQSKAEMENEIQALQAKSGTSPALLFGALVIGAALGVAAVRFLL